MWQELSIFFFVPNRYNIACYVLNMQTEAHIFNYFQQLLVLTFAFKKSAESSWCRLSHLFFFLRERWRGWKLENLNFELKNKMHRISHVKFKLKYTTMETNLLRFFGITASCLSKSNNLFVSRSVHKNQLLWDSCISKKWMVWSGKAGTLQFRSRFILTTINWDSNL
jgi:hypothetical protein